jgi:hypothetical protein
MTVKQLIAGLSVYNPDLPVKFEVPAETAGRHPTLYDVEYFDVRFKQKVYYAELMCAEPDFLILKDKLS